MILYNSIGITLALLIGVYIAYRASALFTRAGVVIDRANKVLDMAASHGEITDRSNGKTAEAIQALRNVAEEEIVSARKAAIEAREVAAETKECVQKVAGKIDQAIKSAPLPAGEIVMELHGTAKVES